MTNKNALDEGRRLQAEAVAAQEEADKIQPYPSQAQIDAAKAGIVGTDEPEGDDEPEGEANASAKSTEKSESAEKPATYKTRAAKAD